MLCRLMILCGSLLLIAACQDLPSGPEVPANSMDASPQKILLEPIIVIGKCDPWMSLDWCGGEGDCMMSNGDVQMLQGCGDPWTGGGGAGPAPDDGTKPCPIENPDCMKEMSPEQREAVFIARSMFKTEFTDLAAQQACAAMSTALDNIPVYQGNPLIDDAEGRSHSGQYQNGVIHIDADWFNQAIAMGDYRTLGYLLLHEAAHSLGYRHVGETSAPYSTQPFNYVSSGSGAETCIE
jgi:hypothetical protein